MGALGEFFVRDDCVDGLTVSLCAGFCMISSLVGARSASPPLSSCYENADMHSKAATLPLSRGIANDRAMKKSRKPPQCRPCQYYNCDPLSQCCSWSFCGCCVAVVNGV